MDGSPSGNFILIFILVMINAFFASAEMAIVSINKTKVSLLADGGNKKAKLLLNLVKEPSNFLATIQVGITFAGFFASASAATSISAGLAEFLASVGVSYSSNIALILITLLISYITLVLGELLPKRIALQNAEKVAMFSVKPVIFISKLTKPFVWFLSASTNLLLKILGIKSEGLEEKVSREEIKSLIELGEEQGALNETERNMIDGIIQFDDILAKEIMTPRTETFYLEVNSNLKDNLNTILEESYSRIPIYHDDIDNIVGILYMKDILSSIVNSGIENLSIESIMRKPYMVPETINIDNLLKELKSTKNHLAILIDEYGGFSGIVTLEDLIEEVIGEISDEYDDNYSKIKKLDDKNYIVDGLVTISDINKHLDLNLESEIIDTVGGLVIEKLGIVTSDCVDKEISINSMVFKILSLNNKRIDKIQITLI